MNFYCTDMMIFCLFKEQDKVTQNPGNNTKSAEKNIIQGAQQDKVFVPYLSINDYLIFKKPSR